MIKFPNYRAAIGLVVSLFTMSQAFGQTTISGSVSGIWTKANSPYTLNGAVTVPNGQTLTIEPGVVVESPNYGAEMHIYGTLLAQGTASDSIYFKGKASPEYASNSSHGGTIYFFSGSSASILNYVSIDQMGDISAGGRAIDVAVGETPAISNMAIAHSEQYDVLTWIGGAKNFSAVKAVVTVNSSAGNIDAEMPYLGSDASFYRLLGDVSVSKDYKLTIAPGVIIESTHYNANLYVYGTLLAQGTATDSVYFKGKANPGYASGSTHGGTIYFFSGSSASVLDYVSIDQMGDISSGGKAVEISVGETPAIRHTAIAHSEQYDVLTWIGGAKNLSAVHAIISVSSSAGNMDAEMANLGSGSSFYRLITDISVSKNYKLTIAPGVLIETLNYNTNLYVYGTLLAQGTATDSIYFKGKANPGYTANSSHGGGIYFFAGSSESVLQYVSIDQMGDLSSAGRAVSIDSDGVSITKSTISNSESVGIHITNAGLSPVLSENRFINIPKTIYSHPGSCAGISNNEGGNIYLSGGDITVSSIWPNPGTDAFYQLDIGANVNVREGAALEIRPGVAVHSHSYSDYISVAGKLVAKGTASDSIRFIGFSNTAYTAPSTHGGQLYFTNTSNGSELEYVVVDRWGDQQSFGSAVSINSTGVSITKSTFRNNEDRGILIAESVSPVISGNRFVNNPKAISSHPGGSGGITANEGGIVFLTSGDITGSSIWPNPGSNAYYQLEIGNNINVREGATLEIKPGAKIHSHFYGDYIAVAGKLIAKGTAADSIRFVGFSNTAYTAPSTHGGQLYFANTSNGSELEYVVVDRWGDQESFGSAVSLNTTGVSITRSTIRNSEDKGMLTAASVSPVISGNRFVNNPKAISSHPSGTGGITANEGGIVFLTSGDITESSIWANPGNGSYYQLELGNSINVREGATLEIKPGVAVHSHSYNDYILIAGKLIAKGSEADSIRFIGFANTAYTAPSTHGGQLHFSNTSNGSELEYVVVDRWGDQESFGSAIQIGTSGVRIDKSTIRNSEGSGIYNNGPAPVISTSNIYGNATGFHNAAGQPVFTANKIYSNALFGVNNVGIDSVDARNTYWGTPTGPFHASLNATGEGNKVSDHVKFIPWIEQLTKVDQAITLASIPDQYVDETVVLSATATSELPVSFTISTQPATGVATLTGNTITFQGTVGLVTVQATQAGNEFFKPADLQATFHVLKRDQTISFESINTKTFGDAPFSLNATATSGLNVTFAIISGPATVNGNTVTLTAPGTVTVEARQAGNTTYNPAVAVQQSFVVYARLPDLAVKNVTSGQSNVGPNDVVNVSWEIANEGIANSLINWTERIYMQSPSGENRTQIKQINYSANGALTPGQTVGRSDAVTIPEQLAVGDQAVFVVEMIPGANVGEAPGTQANNIATQQSPWTVTKILSVTLSANSVMEGAGSLVATIYRTGSLLNNLAVTFSFNNPSRLSFPASVSIPAGQAGVSFNISVPDNTTIEGTATEQIQISSPGFQSASASFSVIDNDMPTLSITELPASAMEGQTVTFKVATNLAPASPLIVYLQSNNSTRFPVPASATIAAGALEATVNVTLVQDNIPEIDLSASVTAGAANHKPATASIQIQDDDLPNLELILLSSSLAESAGINATQAILRRTPSSNPVAFTANLSASTLNTLILPGAISLAAGENEKTFTVGVVDNNIVDGQRQVTINASIFVASCNCNTPAATSGSVSSIVTINDNDGPSLQLSVTQQTLGEGLTHAGAMRITRNTATNNSLTVALTSSDLTEATVPATAVIPAGETFVEVSITTLNDGVADGNQQVYFSATSDGFSAGSTWVIVTDLNKPDLQIPLVQLSSASIAAGTIFDYQVSIKNSGASTAPAGTLVRGYLSADNVIDASDILIAENVLAEAIPAGQTRILINAAKAPESQGSYKLLFWANPTGTLTELLLHNNFSEPVNFTIQPNYTATATVAPEYFLQGGNVAITGSATRGDGSAAANVEVEVYIITQGIRRRVSAITNGSGNYATQFTPLSTEAGHYVVGASAPGLNQATGQDEFDILGVKINGGITAQFKAILNEALNGSLSIENLSNKTLNNLDIAPISLPNGASISFSPIATMAGNASGNVQYAVTGSELTAGNYFEVASFQVKSQEGVIQNANTYYFCQAANGYLASNTSSIQTSVSQSSGERRVELMLVNKGQGGTGNITVNLPTANWLSSITSQTLPSIPPGDSAVVILKFLATADVPFNYPISGSIGFSAASGNAFTIPFSFEKVSEASGTARVSVTDQFTYYAAGGPKVQGALVTIKDYFTGQVYAEGTSGVDGVFTANNVPEGKHRITVAKEKHAAYSNVLVINPGRTVEHEAFLSYEAITFSWNVEPTAVQDRYEVTLESKFETNVPMPVVTMEMPKTMPKLAEGQVYSFYITATNHGLITAEQMTLSLPLDDSEYEFVTNFVPIDLLPNQSIQIPVLMQRRSGFTGGRIASTNGLLCVATAAVRYVYECARKHLPGLALQPFNFDGRCPDNPGGGQPGGGPGGGGLTVEQLAAYYDALAAGYANLNQILPPCVHCGGGLDGIGGVQPPIEQEQEKISCVKCIADMLGAVVGCFPFGDKFGLPICGLGVALDPYNNQKGVDMVQCILDDDKGKKMDDLLPDVPFIGCIQDIVDAIETCKNAEPLGENGRLNASMVASLGKQLRMSEELPNAAFEEIQNNLKITITGYEALRNWMKEYFGEMINNESWNVLFPLVQPYVNDLTPIPANVQSQIIAAMAGYDINSTDISAFFTRWNTSLEALSNNVQSPNSQYPNIINWTLIDLYIPAYINAHNYAINKGFQAIGDMHFKSVTSLKQILDGQSEGVCASVTVQFKQQVAFTREAFEGTLEIFNGHPTDAMKTIAVNLLITDENGTPSNGLFEIQTKSLTGISDVTGNGQINAAQKGSVKFLFIPELGAAPQTPKVYRFGGSITYFDPYANAVVTLPLSAVPITVNPSPNLMLHYFMQRNILGDDALTSPEIEPSIPAELSVMVENKGHGPAVNMTISSAQPTIVDNEKGLAINFKLTGSNFQGQPKQMGVTNINFGTIPALQTRVGQWYFTSSLLGKFVAYDAKVVHSNSFGNPDLSLVQGVKLHELTKSIRLYGTLADGINDFLVNDIFDVNDRPDMIYFSQGNRTAKVNEAASASFDAPVSGPSFTNTLTVMPSDTGFNYMKIDDPGNKAYELVSVTRNDGQAIPLDNAWLTFVTLPVSRSPVYENKFHIVDRFASNSAATYTVIWKPANQDVPKIDSISGAPAQVSAVQVKKLRVHFNKAIDASTFNYEDLNLTLQGGANIINSSVTVTPVDAQTFEVDLTAVTVGNGFYNFTAQAAQVEDSFGTPGQVGKQISWSQFLDVPIVQEFQGIPANRKAASFTTIQLLFNLPIDVLTLVPARFGIYQNSTLLPGSISVESVSQDRRLVTLTGLQNVMTQAGTYELRVDMPQIKSENQVAGAIIQAITLVIDNAGPAVSLLEKSYTGGLDAQHVPFVHIRFNEGVVGLNTAAFRLTRNGENLPLAIDQLAFVDAKNWLAGNFGVLTYPEGNYLFTADLTKIVDSTGNAGTGSQQVAWTVNRASNIAVTDLAIGPDLGHSDTDGITSGTSLTVAYHLSANAAQVTISQVDASSETVLVNIPNVGAGDRTATVNLAGGGQTKIKITVTSATGGIATAEKAVFVDQLPLFAQWKFSAGQQLTTQASAVPLAFSAKLLTTSGLLAAMELRRNGAIVPAAGLGLQAVNDTLYNITGLNTVSPEAGNYRLTLNIQGLAKYSSGKTNAGTASVSWTVLSANRQPVANAGPDVPVTAPGTVQLNAAASTDPDGDALTYSWVAPEGVVLTGATSASPTLMLTEQDRNKVYSILLIVSDGTLFSTDQVVVSFNSVVSFSGLEGRYCENAAPVALVATPAGGVFSGPGVTGSTFDPDAAGAGTHTISYTYSGQIFSGTTTVYAAPTLGKDTVVTIVCENEKIDLVAMFTHEGLNAVWDTATPENAGIGTYKLIATNVANCSDTLTVTISQSISTWTGAVSSDWQEPQNWDNGVLPTQLSHVRIPAATPTCAIENDVSIATITLEKGSDVKIEAGVRVTMTAQCLP